ncbi:MAG: hypothetical protein ABI528_10910 [bacterium]
MKKIKFIKLSALFLLLNALIIFSPADTFADNKGKVISGKVVYSDNNSPVKGGLINVISISAATGRETVIEKTEINSNGEFTIVNVIPGTADNIKIMCYPNDPLDNLQSVPVEFNLNYVIANSVSKDNIVLKVQRTGK